MPDDLPPPTPRADERARTPRAVGRLHRWAGGLLPGATARRAQVARHAVEWAAANLAASRLPGPVWVVLGDSTAQAIGASSTDAGYVGRVRTWLSARDGAAWQVSNLSRSGARIDDVLADQLPFIGEGYALISCAVGANDLLRRTADLETKFRVLAERLPKGSLVANLPRGLRERRAAEVNRHVKDLTERHELRLVDLWAATGPPWRGRYSGDHFHPNDVGYRAWADAFIAALDSPGSADRSEE